MQAVQRTLSILSAVASRPEPVSLVELTRLTGLTASTVHRYLATLVDLGYLQRGADKRFSLAARGLALGASATDPEAIATRVRDSLRRLRSETGETSFASQLAGHEVVCIAMDRGTKPLHLSVRVGQTIPPLHAASARAVLAFVNESSAAKAFDSAADGRGSLTDFRDRLRTIRARGYDICDSEFDHGVWAAAAPVRSSQTGELFGAIAVAGPAATLARTEQSRRVVDLVCAEADRLSTHL